MFERATLRSLREVKKGRTRKRQRRNKVKQSQPLCRRGDELAKILQSGKPINGIDPESAIAFMVLKSVVMVVFRCPHRTITFDPFFPMDRNT